jgi:hypothetical protein
MNEDIEASKRSMSSVAPILKGSAGLLLASLWLRHICRTIQVDGNHCLLISGTISCILRSAYFGINPGYVLFLRHLSSGFSIKKSSRRDGSGVILVLKAASLLSTSLVRDAADFIKTRDRDGTSATRSNGKIGRCSEIGKCNGKKYRSCKGITVVFLVLDHRV